MELTGLEVELDKLALLGRAGEQMNVDLIGAELGAALADLGEVQRRGIVGDAADRENRAAPDASRLTRM